MILLHSNAKLKKLLLKRVRSYKNQAFIKNDFLEIQNNLQEFLFEKQYLKAITFQVPKLEFHANNTEVDLIYEVDNPYYFSISV